MLGKCSVVVPTIGRPSLGVLLDALAAASGPRPAELILVDDRPTGEPLRPERPGLPPVRVVRTGGGGPARARHPRRRTPPPEGIALPPDDGVPGPPRDERLGGDNPAPAPPGAGRPGRGRGPP